MRVARIVQPFVSLGASLLWGMLSGVGVSAFVDWRPNWKSVAPLTRLIPPAVTLRRVTTSVIFGVANPLFP